MDEFRNRGIPSSSHGAPKSAPKKASSGNALKILKEIAACAEVQQILAALGADAYLHLVGGTVREAMSGEGSTDIDLAAALPPNETLARLEKSGIKVVETGLQHGTVLAVINRRHIEITTFRAGRGTYSDSIEQDLQGRDFTINAAAFCLKKLELIDPHGAEKDLKGSLLRAVGDPAARFEEDPLRILRMVRFGPASGRDVEEDTLRAARSLAGKLKSVSAERVQLELRKIVSSPHAAQALRFMANHSLLPNTLPELLPCIGFEQNRYHTQDVFEHTLSVLENCAREGLLRWVALFHDVGKPESLSVGEDGERHFYEHEVISERECKRALKRLRFSNEDQEAVALLVRTHMRPLECGPPGVRRLMRDLGELFETWRAFKIADASPTMPKSEFDERLGRFDELVAKERERLERENAPGLAIGGDDLINLGLKPGPIMGKILKALEEAVLDEPALNERPILIERAKQLIQTHASS